MLSDIIHRKRAPRNDAEELAANARETRGLLDFAVAAETYADGKRQSAEPGQGRWKLERRVVKDRRRRVPPSYTLSGQ